MNFISLFLLEIQFNNYPHYKVLSQRLSKIKIDKVELQAKIEWMVARGRQSPKPFLFFTRIQTRKHFRK